MEQCNRRSFLCGEGRRRTIIFRPDARACNRLLVEGPLPALRGRPVESLKPIYGYRESERFDSNREELESSSGGTADAGAGVVGKLEHLSDGQVCGIVDHVAVQLEDFAGPV